MRKIIAYDDTSAALNHAGTGAYVRNLLAALSSLTADADLEIVTVRMDSRPAQMQRGGLRRRIGVLYRSTLGRNIELPARVRSIGASLFHGTDNLLPMFSPVPAVVTVYDTAVHDFPEAFNLWQRVEYHLMLKASLQRAVRVLTISESAKQDIVRKFGAKEEKIHAIPLAASDVFRPVNHSLVEEIKARYGLSRYILTIGTLEPRKNHVGLIAAFEEARRRGQLNGVTLVHVGSVGWKLPTGLSEVMQRGGDVRFLGHVPLTDLIALLSGADVMAYPSFYEGFGLPILEAMQVGTPVLCSDIPVFREVAGNAGLLVDPYSISSIADGLIHMMNDADLRLQLRNAGLDRSKLFSWSRCARGTIDVYRAALNMPIGSA